MRTDTAFELTKRDNNHINRCSGHLGLQLLKFSLCVYLIDVHLIHGRAPHTWVCTSYMGVHLIHGRAPQAVAVRMQNWNRPEDIAAQGPGLKESIEKPTTPLPEGTAKITQR